jgi:hypothetical protein
MATRRRKGTKRRKTRKTAKRRTTKRARKSAKRRSNQIPLPILEKRAGKLVRLVAKRGGRIK